MRQIIDHRTYIFDGRQRHCESVLDRGRPERRVAELDELALLVVRPVQTAEYVCFAIEHGLPQALPVR